MSTPALDRATEALLNPGVMLPNDSTLRREILARAAVSAALHAPDDPDWMPTLIDLHDPEVRFWRDGSYKETYCYGCKAVLPKETYGPAHQADAVRAAILGEAS